MSSVRMVALVELRRRWRGLVVVVVLVGLVGAVVMSSIAGARRTSTSLTRFTAESRAATAGVIVSDPSRAQLRAFGRLPDVEAMAVGENLIINVDGAPNLNVAAAVDEKLGAVIDRGRIISGRAANPSSPFEVTIGESLAAQTHQGVGGHLDGESFTPEQLAAIEGGADVPPAGPRLRFRIVGIVRRPLDLGRQGALGGALFLTPAFDRAFQTRIGNFGYVVRVRTRDGDADLPALRVAAVRIFGSSPKPTVQSAASGSGGTQSGIDVLALALLIFAGVTALAGSVAVGIVLTREISSLGVDQPTLRALGMTRSELVMISGLRAIVIAVGGALLAVFSAMGASLLFPIGVARLAEPDPGLNVDWVVLAVGVVALVALVAAIAFVAALRSTPSSKRGSPVGRESVAVARFAASPGFSPAAAQGVRMAFQPGQERPAVPIRSAIVGAVVGVVGVVAALTFSSSLTHLVATPALYGWTADLASAPTLGNGGCTTDSFGVLKVRGVGAAAVACFSTGEIQVDGYTVNGWSFVSLRGTIDPTVVAGRAPRGPSEVALGSVTLRVIGKHIGDTVHVNGLNGGSDYQIVGQAVFPTLGQKQPLADSAAFTGEGFAPFFNQNNYNPVLLLRYAPGANHTAVQKRLAAIPHLDPPATPTVPVEIDRLRQVDSFPAILAGLLTLLALIAVGHAVVTAVRRRRTELATLKALGFNPRQVRATIAWQATMLTIVGLLVGIPLGLITGRLAWHLAAHALGVSTLVTIPVLGPLAAIPISIALINLIAHHPARNAARTRPATAFRTE